MAEIILLNRIRVDIGEVSGSITELLQYADMAGFNDNYEPQTKPRLVGTWTVNNWYTQEQLAQAQAAFDGLTVVGDPNYLIKFDDLAVQVLDSTKPNYNPGFAIKLQQNGYGVTLKKAPLSHGRWFITKNQAANITRFGNTMKNIQSQIVDSNNIIDGGSYSFDLKELYYFTSLQAEYNMFEHSGVTNFGVPPHWKNIVNLGNVFYVHATNVFIQNLDNYIQLCGYNGGSHPFLGNNNQHHVYLNDVEITQLNTSNLSNSITGISQYSFYKCPITSIELSDNIEILGRCCFSGTNVTDLYLNNVKSIYGGALETFTNITFKTPNPLKELYGDRVLKNIQYSDGLVENLEIFECRYSPFVFGNVMNFPKIKRADVEVLGNGRFVTLGSDVTHIGHVIGGFKFFTNGTFHILAENPPAISTSSYSGITSSTKIYVGDGSSADHDDAILQTYKTTGNWVNIASYLDTWYNYLHPTT